MSVKKLANPGAYANNMMVAHAGPLGCPCDGLTMCLYRFYSATMASISLITYTEGGVTKTQAVTVDNTSTRTKELSVENALLAAGYDPYYEDIHAKYLGVKIDGKNLIIIGDIELVSVTINGVAVAAVKTCEKGKVCKCTFSVEDNVATELSYLGETNTFEETGSASAVLTAMKAALTDVGVIYHSATSTLADGVHSFVVEIEGDCADFKVDGVSSLTHSCKPYFVGLVQASAMTQEEVNTIDEEGEAPAELKKGKGKKKVDEES